VKSSTRKRIFLSPPETTEADRDALLRAFESGWVAPVGPSIRSFEKAFETIMGGGHAVALVSGTAALHLALQLAGVRPGDEVFCASLTFVATGNAILYCGARPVFVDSDERTWNMDVELLADALKQRARANSLPSALVVVHAYGQCADMEPISQLAQEYGIPLIEDAAEALGANCYGRPAGGFGQFSAFSFNGNKLITTSGGGMLWTPQAEAAERARHLATQARMPDVGYLHQETGYNYRLSNLLAALGESQLTQLEARITRRREVFERYAAAFSALPGVSLMPEAAFGRATRWLSCLRLAPAEAPLTRNELITCLQAEQIESRPVWKPLHTQPLFAGSASYARGVSEQLSAEGICLPSGGTLLGADQAFVIDCILKAFAESS